MSAEDGGAAPMEEEQVPPPNDSPANSAGSMDWVKVDEAPRADSPTTDDVAHAVTQSENLAGEKDVPNFDEYSFGSSDGDDDDEEEVNGKLADVSLDTSFDMGILQRTIEESKDALDLVVDRDVVMVVGKTG